MNSSSLTIINTALSGLAVIAGIYAIITLTKVKRWRKLFNDQGEQPENLEEIITSIAAKIKNLEQTQIHSRQHRAQLEELLSHAIQQVGIVRFNSQADDGGNLSFALALLDAGHNGFVITSLHGRQQNRIYAKQISGGGSEVQLSEEEQNAVFEAIKSAGKVELKPEKPKRVSKLKTKPTNRKTN